MMDEIERIAGGLSERQQAHFRRGTWRDSPGVVGMICAGLVRLDPGRRAQLTPIGEAVAAFLANPHRNTPTEEDHGK
jgi:hypothetical protein